MTVVPTGHGGVRKLVQMTVVPTGHYLIKSVNFYLLAQIYMAVVPTGHSAETNWDGGRVDLTRTNVRFTKEIRLSSSAYLIKC